MIALLRRSRLRNTVPKKIAEGTHINLTVNKADNLWWITMTIGEDDTHRYYVRVDREEALGITKALNDIFSREQQ